jgi:hypothetical protein
LKAIEASRSLLTVKPSRSLVQKNALLALS